jgi:hypothetical protein
MRFSSDTPEFFEALASVDLGQARCVGQAWLPDGRQVIEVLWRRNNPVDEETSMSGQIEIGERFLSRPLKDYTNWRTAWWREAIQNSLDAGATEILLDAQENPDGTWTVSCDDNGKGMNFEEVRGYFLRMGESGKKVGQAGAVGGFGKAKELLVLPWIQWSISYNGGKVVGNGLQFKQMAGEPRKGIRIEVIMPADAKTTLGEARNVLTRSDLKRCQFVLTGIRFDPKDFLVIKDPVRSMAEKGTIYAKKTPKETHYTCLVRHHGLFMFEIYTDKLEAIVVLELEGPSIELLASNRDGFADYSLKSAVSEFINELAKDKEVALRSPDKTIRRIYQGTGPLEAKEQTAKSKAIVEETASAVLAKETWDEEEMEEISTVLEEVSRQGKDTGFKDTEVTSDGFRTHGETIREIIRATSSGNSGTEDRLRLLDTLLWKPNFLVLNERAQVAVPKMFFPESMTPTTLGLARIWSELCKFVLIQIQTFKVFGIGFCFSEDASAMHTVDDGIDWLMLNPYRDPRDPSKGIWRSKNEKDLAMLYALAIHECTHLQGEVYHDKDFAYLMTANVGKCTSGWKDAKRIVSTIPIYGQVKKGKKE